MSPLLSQMDPEDFVPVAQYALLKDCVPFDLGDMSDVQRDVEIVRCGRIYSTAQLLEMVGLQDVAFRKFRTLTENAHVKPLVMLCVIEGILQHGDNDLRQYLAQHVAENYWFIMEEQGKKAIEVMQKDDAFARSVFRLLGATDAPKNKSPSVESEERVTVKLEDTADQVALNAPQLSSVRSSSPRNEVKEEGFTDQSLLQTEVEMVMMALRQSDEEMTEEEIARAIQRQAEYLNDYYGGLGGAS